MSMKSVQREARLETMAAEEEAKQGYPAERSSDERNYEENTAMHAVDD